MRRMGVMLATCLLVLTGCDAIVRVRGSIVSSEGEPVSDCDLVWFDTEKELDTSPKLEPAFSTTFVFGGWEDTYHFVVQCPGYDQTWQSPDYTFDGGTYVMAPLDLGTIVMTMP